MPIYRGITYSHWRYFHDQELQWAPTKKNIENLIDLADRLRYTPPPKFNMGAFANVYHHEKAPTEIMKYVHASTPYDFFKVGEAGLNVATECGTSACAVGTAAFFGIGVPRKSAFEDMDWDDYSEHAFGAKQESEIWSYLFDGEWPPYDNTAEGAAARILSIVSMSPKGLFGEMAKAVHECEKKHWEPYDYQQWQDSREFRKISSKFYARFKDMAIEPLTA